jgi:hypothetical protein
MKFQTLMIRLALLAASSLVALLLCEGLVRVVAPQQLIVVRPDICRPVDGLGWQKQPNVDPEINTGEQSVRLRTDELGFRVGEAGRFPADVDVLLLGDSFMEAIQVEYEESLAGLLEERLGATLGAFVAVWNTAVSGWGPSQYLIQTRDLLEQRHFDLVLVALYLGNDAEAKRHDWIAPRAFVETHSLRWPRDLSWRELVHAILWPVNDFLERRSQLFQLLKVQQRTLLMRLGLSTRRDFPSELLASTKNEAAWHGTATTIRALLDQAMAADIPARIVVIPSHYQLDERALEQLLSGFDSGRADVDTQRPNRVLAAAAAAQGVPLIDATPALLAAQRNGKQVHGLVDTHLSVIGHAVVADLLAPNLVLAIRGADVTESEPSRSE